MKQKAIYPKVSLDMFIVQGTWASGFLGVMIIVQIIKAIFAPINKNELETYLMSTFVAAPIFMFVVGIIATYGFLTHYVGNGVTRKDFFRGASFAAIGLSIVFPLIIYLIWIIEKGILSILNIPFKEVTVDIASIDTDSNLIGDFFQTIFIPVINESANFFLLFVVFAFNLFIYYLAGWVIGSAFYKDTLLGFVGIAIGVVVLYVKSSIIANMLNVPIPTFISDIELSNGIFTMILVALLLICLYLVRTLTKKVVVKV